MGKSITLLGPVGSGALVKLINNFVCGVQVAAIAEAIALIERGGLDRAKALEVLTGGAPGSPLVKTVAARMTAPDVIVNVPDFTLTLWNDNKVYWHTKIVAGKPGKATPMISAEMKFITVNPTWNVPPSIIENEYLPALREDPQALDRIGLKLVQDADGTVHVSPGDTATGVTAKGGIAMTSVSVPPPCDSPDKYLFAKDERAFSHGCMRVQNPLTYGEKILSLVLPNEHYTEARLEKMFGGSEININFPHNIWVHLTYQTAFVDEDGKLQFRKDVYGRDARMIAISRAASARSPTFRSSSTRIRRASR